MDQEKQRSTPTGSNLQEGIDFYLEDGYFVFTEKYLRERGYCCRSGCRHCPYGFRKGKAAGGKKHA